MAEIWAKPNCKDIEKCRELYSDPIIFAFTNALIKTFKDPKTIRRINNFDFAIVGLDRWRALTRLMFLNFAAVKIWAELERIQYEVANNICPELIVKKQKAERKFSEKSKISILEVATKYKLKLYGYKCVCPFHNDSDPSLQFYPETNSFYCFGCRTGGDVIKFVQLMEALK